MNHQFGGDENRKCNEESDLNFNIVKKGKPADVRSWGAEDCEEQ